MTEFEAARLLTNMPGYGLPAVSGPLNVCLSGLGFG